MSKDKELKACPFCGSYSENWAEHDKSCWFYLNEHITASLGSHGSEELAAAWDTRHPDPMLAKAVEALKYIDGKLYTLIHTDGAVKRCRVDLMKAQTCAKQALQEIGGE